MAGRLHLALLVYGALSTILYSNLLPLWDGFDEPFHFALVQHLAHTRELPVTGKTLISGEVRRSLELAPASHLVKLNLPFVTTFADYFELPPEEISRRRRELETLHDPGFALAPGGYNYEAQQAPLAYALLAPWENWSRGSSLLSRVIRLRLIAGFAAVFAIWCLTRIIATQLALTDPFQLVALFLIFSSQVFYATTAHIANDWLTVVMFSLIIACAIAFAHAPRRFR